MTDGLTAKHSSTGAMCRLKMNPNGGTTFFLWLLEKPDVLQDNFYLVRQAVKDIPHSGDDNVAQLMRSQSKAIADAYPDFQNLRIKIHGQPTRSDIQSVREFQQKNAANLSASLNSQFDELISTMDDFFAPVNIEDLKSGLAEVSRQRFEKRAGLHK